MLPHTVRLAESTSRKSLNGRSDCFSRFHFHWLMASSTETMNVTLVRVVKKAKKVFSVMDHGRVRSVLPSYSRSTTMIAGCIVSSAVCSTINFYKFLISVLTD